MEEFELKVTGMMCTGCENRVKKVVKEIKGIESVEADHNTGIVKIKCDTDVNMKEVKEAIEDLDFKVE